MQTSKRRALPPILIVLIVLIGACHDNNRSTPPVVVVPPTVTPIAPTVTVINDDLRRLSFDLSQSTMDGFVDVTLTAEDVSVYLNLSAIDADSAIYISEIRDPDDVVIHTATVDVSTGEVTMLTSDAAEATVANQGDLAFSFPHTTETPLKVGRYRFAFETTSAIDFTKVDAYVKSVPAGSDIDMLKYALDIDMWIAHADPDFTSDAFKQRLQVEYKDHMNRLLSPHMLEIGTITIYEAAAAEVTRFTDLDVEADLDAVCAAIAAAGTEQQAVQLGFVTSINIPGEAPGTGPAGVAPGAGLIFDDSARKTCVLVAENAYRVDPVAGIDQALADLQQASNIVHETGHFMSLPHTTEEDGISFDAFADTPMCDAMTFDGRTSPTFNVPGTIDGIVDDFECDTDGGANNVLFWAGDPNFTPFTMSEQQAQLLRRHPLFKRVP